MLDRIVRGSTVTFTVTFADAVGVAIDPDSAALHLSFMNEGERVSEELAMEMQTDLTWIAEWNTIEADAGRVYWSARSVNPYSAQDGQFELTANLANPDTETA